MRKISLLDCTLRDGGYINNWNFGFSVIRSMLAKLYASNVELVECGYLSEKKGGSRDATQFADFDAIRAVLPESSGKTRTAVMIDFGQYQIDHIPEAAPDAPIIRVCFHKEDREAALAFCGRLIEKGYSVFVQPMASLNYTDTEFIELIEKTNALHPDCFYIVDSFGVIEIRDFTRLLFLTDRNLAEGIQIGYHAHNNLQQAYGNAKFMIEQNLTHDIILDASVYGMGRGAGNLNMELFASHLNENYSKAYHIDNFLEIIDAYLKPIFVEHYWGYSLPFYLSAVNNCHPNYAAYFSDKNTLTNRSIRELLASLPADVKDHYSPELAERYYAEYQGRYIDDSAAMAELGAALSGREVMLLAPGRSIVTQQEQLAAYIAAHHPVIIAVNVIPEGYHPDYIFCANEKRLHALGSDFSGKLIISSNISTDGEAMRVNYSSYTGGAGLIADNPALMVIRMLIALGITEAAVAGLDGYGAVSAENYCDSSLALGSSIHLKIERNELIRNELSRLQGNIALHFLTPSKYQA